MTTTEHDRPPTWQPARPATATATGEDPPDEEPRARTCTRAYTREAAAALWDALRVPIARGVSDELDRGERHTRYVHAEAAVREETGQAGHRSFWRVGPATVADVVAWVRDGAVVPGERHPALEFLGRAYGWLLAVPVTVLAYALAYVVQRPSRFLTALGVIGTWLLLGWLFGATDAAAEAIATAGGDG